MTIHDLTERWEAAVVRAAEASAREHELDDDALTEAAGLAVRSAVRVAGCKT